MSEGHGDLAQSGDTASTRQVLEGGLAGRYEILDEIGHGGMAIVFRARDIRHDRHVAIKVLRPELAVALGAERFEREIKIEARLNHQNVLALFDSGRCRHLLYYVAPWAEEGSLKERLRNTTTLSIEDAVRVTREVGEALAHAHANGIVHRDVKPDNILFRSGHAMLADFGIAHAAAEGLVPSLTQSGMAVGTPKYMSPEQGAGEIHVDGRSDQYALACILFEMLTGDPPFTGRSAQSIIARHLSDQPPSLAAIRPDVPPAVVAAVERALRKRAQDRFATITDFVDALSLSESGAFRSEQQRAERRRRLATAGVVVLGLAVLSTLALQPPPPTLSSTNVAIFPLGVRGLVAGDSGIGVGIAYLLEAALERAEPLRLIDITTELSPEGLQNPEGISGATANRIARDAHAGWLLRGVLQGHADSVTIILRLYSVAGDSLVRQVSVSGDAVSALPYRLGIDAIKLLLPSLIEPTREVDLGPLRDRSAAAIALWMQGERRYRQSKFSEAVEFYERALAVDSSLALAAVKGAWAAEWLHDEAKAIALVAMALSRDSLLPPRYAAFARALQFRLRGEADSAVAGIMAVMRTSPDWAEASFALGETYYHLLPVTGGGDALARRAFERSIAADSGFAPPLFHLAEMAFREGRVAEGRRLVEHFARGAPDAALLGQLTLLRSCVEDGPPKEWSRGSGVLPPGSLNAAKTLSVGARHHRCAESGFRAVLGSPMATPNERWGAFVGLQGVLIARGAVQEARALIDSAVAGGSGAARSLYVLASAAGADMRAQARELDEFARERYGQDYAKVRTSESLWVLSVWHLSTGDRDRLRTLESLLTAQAKRTGDPRDAMYAAAAVAHGALVDGDTVQAIARLQALPSAGTSAQVLWEFGDALGPDRLLLAQLLLATGRPRESLEAAMVFDNAQSIMFVPFVATSLGVRYRAARALNDVTAATEARRRLERLDRQDLIQ